MNKQIIKSLIGEYQHLARNIKIVKRDVSFDVNTNYILVGVRRAGKSYLLYQDIQKMIEDGNITEEGFVYINFEDERISGIKGNELGEIIDCYKEIYGTSSFFVYLDEVQNIDGWEKFARRLADMKYRVMITGSNAKMLGREVATTLGGRYIPRFTEPFSFTEYLKFIGIEAGSNWEYDPERRIAVYKAFEAYFKNGGFAEAFNKPDKREYLNSLYQKILMGDIVERYKIRNSRVFRLLGRKLAESVMQPTTLTRLKHIIDSTGEKISMPVMKDYLDYMSDACLTFSIPNMLSALTDQETTKKRYFVDNGILNLFLIDEDTKLLENLVAITLHSRYRNTDEELRMFYYNKGVEIDFCVPEDKIAIQVSYDIEKNLDTYEREAGGLASFISSHPDYTGIIITYDSEKEIIFNGRKIQVIPVWKWLVKF